MSNTNYSHNTDNAEGTEKSEFQIESFTIDLGPNNIHNENTVLGWVFIEPFDNGSIAAAFQNKNDVYLYFLDSTFKKFEDPIILKNYHFSDMKAMKNNSLTLLLGHDVNNTYINGYANTLYAVQIDQNGKEIFNTYIFGGTGTWPG